MLQIANRRWHPNSATSSTSSNGTINTFGNTKAEAIPGVLSLSMIEKVDLIYERRIEYYFTNTKGFFLKADKEFTAIFSR
jgi:hypothetical protein